MPMERTADWSTKTYFCSSLPFYGRSGDFPTSEAGVASSIPWRTRCKKGLEWIYSWFLRPTSVPQSQPTWLHVTQQRVVSCMDDTSRLEYWWGKQPRETKFKQLKLGSDCSYVAGWRLGGIASPLTWFWKSS